MTEQPLSTRPISPETKFLREKYYTAKTTQADLMDQLARDLLKIELAVPGIYATVLKFIEGTNDKVPSSSLLYAMLCCWGGSLFCTVVSLFPRKWRVDTSKIKGDPSGDQESLSLEGFFTKSAGYKRGWLMVSVFSFFVGLVLAVLLTFES